MKLKLVLVLLIIISISSCAQSRVGGSYTKKEGPTSSSTELHAHCDGSCIEFNPDGSCVKFTKDISGVCQSHLLFAASLNGDCNPLILENRGIVEITYEKGAC